MSYNFEKEKLTLTIFCIRNIQSTILLLSMEITAIFKERIMLTA